MKSDLLHAAGLRSTHRREVILQVLSEAGIPMTAEEIYTKAVALDKMGLSTAYRVLAQLTDCGVLLKNEGGNGLSYYQLSCAASHKHTLHCAVCGQVVSIGGCPLAELEHRLTDETGYTITGHSLTFTGVCPECKANGAACPPAVHTEQ